MTLVDRDGGVADDAIYRTSSRATIVVVTVVAASIPIDELADGHHHLPFRSHVEIEAVPSSLGLQAVLNRRPFASRPRAAPRGGRIDPVSA